VSDSLLLHVRLLRSTLEFVAQEATTVDLVADHHGSLGYRHDAHGHSTKLRGIAGCENLPRRHGSWVRSPQNPVFALIRHTLRPNVFVRLMYLPE
jgi:hypothetical protein